MKKITVDQIESGMILAKPIIGPVGNVLLNEGTVIQSNIVSRLKTWGIASLYIQTESKEAPEKVEKQDHSELEKKLKEKFGLVLDSALMVGVMQTIKDHRLKQQP